MWNFPAVCLERFRKSGKEAGSRAAGGCFEGEPFRRCEGGLSREEEKGPRQRHPAEVGSAASRERVSGGRAEGGTRAGAQEERRLKGPLRSRDAFTPVPSKLLLPASPGHGSCAAAVPALLAALQGLRRALRHAARPAAAAASHRHPGRSPAARSVGWWPEGGSAFGGCRCPAWETLCALP